MQNILVGDGAAILQAFCRKPTLFAFDYDGTLAPVVDKPHEAHMRPRTAERLEALAKRAKVAVITGRGCDDVKRFLGPDIHYVVGNHGIEGLPGGEGPSHAARAAASAWHDALMRKSFADPALRIEAKLFSLTVHSRGSSDPELATATILAAVAGLMPAPRVVLGKDVVNLVSVDAPHKGHAMQTLLQAARCPVGVFLGDDTTDEDVFNLDDPRILGIRVGAHPQSRAAYFVPHQTDIDQVLELLAACSR